MCASKTVIEHVIEMNDHESRAVGYKESSVSKRIYARELPPSASGQHHRAPNQRAFKQQVIERRVSAPSQATTTASGLSHLASLTQSQLHEQFYQQFHSHNDQNDGTNQLISALSSCANPAETLLDEDISPYWSDSTLSNCDREPSSQSVQTRLAGQDTQPSYTKHDYDQRHQDRLGDKSLPRATHSDTLNGANKYHAIKSSPSPSSSTESTPTTSQRRCNNNGGQPRGVRKRVMANERERERTKSLNDALETLRNRLPVPDAEKRSKIQTLRMAKEYIEFLAKFKRISAQQQQQRQQHQQQQQSNRMNPDDSNGQPLMLADESVKQYRGGNCNSYNNNCEPFVVNNNLQQSSVDKSANQNHQPDSPLTYKFYKFRLKIRARCD